MVVMPLVARAQVWHVTPSISAKETFTDNVLLVPASQGRTSDWVTELTPTIAFTEQSAHTRFAGSIATPILLYARTGRNDDIRPEVNVAGTTELYPRTLFVDTSVQVAQEFVSPFAPRPIDLVNATDNRLTAQFYRVAPYVKGDAPGNLHYQLRDDNEWTVTNGAANAVLGTRAYTNELNGGVVRDPLPLGWTVSYDRAETQFADVGGTFLTEIGRGQLTWLAERSLMFALTGGYEEERYPLQRFSDAIYGAAVRWAPTARTRLDASWEHRFFGGSYHVTFEHRTPLTVWSLTGLRDISTYPQELGNLNVQGSVSALLNSLFLSRIPDPTQRQTAVDQIIRDRGLPSTLNGPLNLVSQQVTLQQSVVASAGILGARNSILLSAYHAKTEPVAEAQSLPQILALQTNNTQTGGEVNWSYRLTALYTLATTFDWVRSVANDSSGLATRQGTVQSVVSAPLSALTNVFAGARFQWITSSAADQVHEAAVFVGVNHLFR